MTTAVCTTFSKDGYDLYGHRMIESWIKYWPTDIQLYVYVENFNIKETDPRIVQIDLNQVSPELLKFKQHSQDLLLQNTKDKKWKSRIEKTVKWCHKVYVISHALKNYKFDYLIFLDGDTYTKDNIPNTFAIDLVKNHLIGVHYENISLGQHIETGLIVFNVNHPQMSKFKEIYTSGYNTLEIYNMDKTWDTFWLLRLIQEYNLDVIDLAKNKRGPIFGHPLIHNKIVHDVGTKKYLKAGYNKFTGKRDD